MIIAVRARSIASVIRIPSTMLALLLAPALLGYLPPLSGSGSAVRASAIDCQVVSAEQGAATPGFSADKVTPAALSFPDDGGALTVFAAASLTDAFELIAADLESTNPGLSITINFAGSQTLVTQLDQGAEADVFASANPAQMQAAISNDSIASEPVVFVYNRLVIVTPRDNPAGIDTSADLAQGDVRLVLAQPEVPAGRYARQSLCEMARDEATYGEDFLARVADNVVSEEDDVRDVLTKVQLGEADAGIVYVSDAASMSDAVELIEIPTGVNVIATYPIAAVEGGDAVLAAAFIATVLSPTSQTALAAAGFDPVQ